jgi:peptidoglycan hydrolase-like amidase
MMKVMKLMVTTRYKLIISMVLLSLVLVLGKTVFAEEECVNYSCLGSKIDKLEELMQLSVAATKPLESEVAKIEDQIKSISAQIQTAEKKLQNLSLSIDDREERLADKYLLMSERVKRYYIRSRSASLLLVLLSARDANTLARDLTYQSRVTADDKATIVGTTEELMQLEKDVQSLNKDKITLAGMQSRLDKQVNFFRGEIKKAKDYQSTLSSQIADLTAKQQAILTEKTETFQTTVGDVPLADDPNSRPDYNPGFSPAFAAFSFGAPHFKGMSQYGAYGRAKAGQSVEDILHAYYGGLEIKKDYSTGVNISVQGYGSVDIETYVKRIYEMPGSWGDNGGMEALKAQAVAARSYALAYTNNGAGSICATEACQVYKSSNKGGKWEEAVNATRGWVLMANGKPFSAWYASTSGGHQLSYTSNGYSTPALWDTPSGRDGWTSQAYEKTAGSPWFYKGWYKSRSGATCGRSHPWLNSEEMADILNAHAVLFGGSGDSGRVTPVGACWGGNPYNMDELRGVGGYTSVSSVSVSYSSDGVTANVTFQTNKGSVTINGADFKKAFNLRAPGNIAIKSGLFNIEKK